MPLAVTYPPLNMADGSPATQVCDACGTANPAAARFCMSCGAALERRCQACGAPNPAEARFCIACGTALEAEPGTPAPTQPAGEALPEERRQVTVLFADLSGYTAVAERLDPEQVKTLVDRCLQRLGDQVEHFGGHVDKYIGDNVMAIFGAPVAHEDDPERAIRAALGMQEAMQEINAELADEQDVSFALRVGVNSGEVVAGAVGGGGGSEGYTVMGDVVNVASRLQAAGQPDSITVGERTMRATRHAVRYRELEPFELKGKSEPVPAWEVEGLVALSPQGRGVQAEAPLVGRSDELEELTGLLERTISGEKPYLVTIVGAAGVGKTRLLREFEEAAARDDSPTARATFRQGRCLPYGSGFSFSALAEVVKIEFGIRDSDSADDAWRKLLDGTNFLFELAGQGSGGEEREAPERRAALIGRLLGIDVPVEVASLEIEDPQRARESFFSAVRAGIEAMARRGPVVLAFEDIHWADEGMLDLIEYLARWVRGPLLIVCLAREELLERRQSWGGGRRGVSAIFLDPLASTETLALVEALLPEGGAEDLAARVTDRAEGNPLFAEEMVRRLVEEGMPTGKAVDAALPDTVHGLLAARLDALDPFERQLVQQAAVVGRVFWEGALVGVAAEHGDDVGAALRALQDKDIVVPGEGQALGTEPEYAFKHVLIRDVAYSMLPKGVRWRKHFEVGRFIEERAGDRIDEVVALLAQHYSRAVELGEEVSAPRSELDPIQQKAVTYLVAAGDRAAALYSNREALALYDQALDRAADDDEALRAGVLESKGEICLRLGQADAAVAAWEECLAYHRVQEDLPRVGDLLRKVGAGLWNKGERKAAIEHYQKGINLLKDGEPCIELVRLYEEAASLYMHTGDNILAIYASEKALRLAERLGEARAASRAHGIFGRVFGRIGDPEKARDNLERSVELARDSDPGETIRALLTLGYHLETSAADYKRAEAAYREGLQLAQRLGDLPSQVELWAAIAQIAFHRADWDEVESATETSAGLAEREGLVGKLCFPYVMRGVILWREGDWEAAERTYEQARELAEQVGWSEVTFSALYGLGVVRRDRGAYNEAVDALGQALDVCERAGLIAQSIQAMSARAVTLAAAKRMDQAREAAGEAVRLADRLHYPVGTAAAYEAEGLVKAACDEPEEGRARLEEAQAAWRELGRPFDAARCDYLIGKAILACKGDEATARKHLAAAQAEFERLRVGHMARHAAEAQAALA